MLKDARGYRSHYINALNGAVAAARVVGGDVIPEETPSGTLLTIAQTRRAGRFELFCGYDNGGESGADAFCLSDGTLYVAAVAQELKPGREVFRRDGDLMPRANGWCTRKTITEAQTLTFACCRHNGEYFLIAKRADEKASALLPEALGEISENEVEELFTFGQFYWQGKTGDKSINIRQDIHGDVWYGGAATSAPAAEVIRPLTICKFLIEQASSSGTTTVTKWGCYMPDKFCVRLYVEEENTKTDSFTQFDSIYLNIPEAAFLPGNEHWVNITDAVESAKVSAATPYVSLHLFIDSSGSVQFEAVLLASAEVTAFNPGEGSSSTAAGYNVPLASVSAGAEGEAIVSQFRYGPLTENLSLDGKILMACADDTKINQRSAWVKVEQGSELSAENTYAYVDQENMHLVSHSSTLGHQETSPAFRHQADWNTLVYRVYIRPLSLTNFGAILK